MPSNGRDAHRRGESRNGRAAAQAPAGGVRQRQQGVDETRPVQYDQYGNPLDDGFGYTPEMDDFVYDGTDDSGYGVPIDPDAYAASLYEGQNQGAPASGQYGSQGAGYDYQYDGGGYQYYPQPGSGERQAGRPVEPSPQRKPRHHHRGLIALVVVVAAIVGLYVALCGPIDQRLAFGAGEADGLSQQETPHIPGLPYYVLALGSDAREGDTASRTDTMMLVRIDPIASKVTLLSIPRDTMVDLDGHGTSKINAAYAYGGATMATQAVKDLTNLPVSHVAVVHFEQLSELVDSIGGITVDVPVDVNDPNYTGLVMSAGTYQMDGQTALLFSRVRHGFANGDFQRQADQQLVIKAIVDKVLSLPPTQMAGVIDSLGDLVSTDMRLYEILPLMLRFQITSPTIYSCSLPGESIMSGGVSYVTVWQQDSSGRPVVGTLSDDALKTLKAVDAGQDPNASDSNEAAASAGALSAAS